MANFCNMLSLVIGGRHGAVHVDDVFSITQSVFSFHALIRLCFRLFFYWIVQDPVMLQFIRDAVGSLVVISVLTNYAECHTEHVGLGFFIF